LLSIVWHAVWLVARLRIALLALLARLARPRLMWLGARLVNLGLLLLLRFALRLARLSRCGGGGRARSPQCADERRRESRQ
jgi:hypothetical protein